MLMALKAYRSACEGETWVEIGRHGGKHESTMRAAAKQLALSIGLPWPVERGSVLPELPDADCVTCPKRRSPRFCEDCPVPAYMMRLEQQGVIPPSEIKGSEVEPPGT